jgi:hypothetical protein
MPSGRWDVGSDQGGFAPIAFLDDFEQVKALPVREGMGSEVVEDEQLRVGELIDEAGKPAIGGGRAPDPRTGPARAHRARNDRAVPLAGRRRMLTMTLGTKVWTLSKRPRTKGAIQLEITTTIGLALAKLANRQRRVPSAKSDSELALSQGGCFEQYASKNIDAVGLHTLDILWTSHARATATS